MLSLAAITVEFSRSAASAKRADSGPKSPMNTFVDTFSSRVTGTVPAAYENGVSPVKRPVLGRYCSSAAAARYPACKVSCERIASEASPEVTTGGRSLNDVRSDNLRSMASAASAEAPRVVNRLPRPMEMCKRVPLSTARPTARLRRSYASIGRNAPGYLRRRNMPPSKSTAVRINKPRAIMRNFLRANSEQRLVTLLLLQACEQVSPIFSHPETADRDKPPARSERSEVLRLPEATRQHRLV